MQVVGGRIIMETYEKEVYLRFLKNMPLSKWDKSVSNNIYSFFKNEVKRGRLSHMPTIKEVEEAPSLFEVKRTEWYKKEREIQKAEAEKRIEEAKERLAKIPGLERVTSEGTITEKRLFGEEETKTTPAPTPVTTPKQEQEPTKPTKTKPPLTISNRFKIYIDSNPTRARLYIDDVYTHHYTPCNERELKDVKNLLTIGKHKFKAEKKVGKQILSGSVEIEIADADNGNIIINLE
jgi:hypothetical protein